MAVDVSLRSLLLCIPFFLAGCASVDRPSYAQISWENDDLGAMARQDPNLIDALTQLRDDAFSNAPSKRRPGETDTCAVSEVGFEADFALALLDGDGDYQRRRRVVLAHVEEAIAEHLVPKIELSTTYTDGELARAIEAQAVRDQAAMKAMFALVQNADEIADFKALVILVNRRSCELMAEAAPLLDRVLTDIGWPTPPRFDESVPDRFWLLVQHQDQDVDLMERGLRALRLAVDRYPRGRRNLAYLEDRVAVNRGRPQIYGTQVFYDELGCNPGLSTDLELLDDRRATAGLQSLQEYYSEHPGCRQSD